MHHEGRGPEQCVKGGQEKDFDVVRSRCCWVQMPLVRGIWRTGESGRSIGWAHGRWREGTLLNPNASLLTFGIVLINHGVP